MGARMMAQIHLFNYLYVVVVAVVALFSRATGRRIGGARVGAVAFVPVARYIIGVREKATIRSI